MLPHWLQLTEECRQQVTQGAETPALDPEAVKKAEDEAEERRLAEIRSHGTMITPQTFAEWKTRFEAEMALERAKVGEGGDKKDKGLTGKQFFRQLEANNEQVRPCDSKQSLKLSCVYRSHVKSILDQHCPCLIQWGGLQKDQPCVIAYRSQRKTWTAMRMMTMTMRMERTTTMRRKVTHI